jgi:hypothetical protein
LRGPAFELLPVTAVSVLAFPFVIHWGSSLSD